MDYAFYYPCCNRKETISMRMSEYVSTGHKCSIDNTNTFYRKVN